PGPGAPAALPAGTPGSRGAPGGARSNCGAARRTRRNGPWPAKVSRAMRGETPRTDVAARGRRSIRAQPPVGGCSGAAIWARRAGMEPVTVIGAGLAGSECAVQLARRGIPVRLCEMKPQRRSPAHRMDGPAELVCSNSFRSDSPETPIGLLHAELRRLGSLILGEADRCRVPAGEALAVDRERFSAGVERELATAPGLERVSGEVEALPAGDVVVATGPLTSDALTAALSRWTGDKLYFYDSIAPIVGADSVDETAAFRASRWGRGDGADYLNLPLDETQYRAFVRELLAAEKVVPHAFEEPRYFEGCLPIEVMAERGEETLAHGPMKPVGLIDPRTGRRAHAVVQLRQEDVGGTAYN